MPKFEVKMVVSGYYWAGTAQDLADLIQKGVRRVVELDVETIEVKEVGMKIQRGKTYFRR